MRRAQQAQRGPVALPKQQRYKNVVRPQGPTSRHIARRASKDRRRNHRRLLVHGRREKVEHAADDVREIIVTIARMLDRILAASMRAPLE
jgi:hypothetical protein